MAVERIALRKCAMFRAVYLNRVFRGPTFRLAVIPAFSHHTEAIYNARYIECADGALFGMLFLGVSPRDSTRWTKRLRDRL